MVPDFTVPLHVGLGRLALFEVRRCRDSAAWIRAEVARAGAENCHPHALQRADGQESEAGPWAGMAALMALYGLWLEQSA